MVLRAERVDDAIAALVGSAEGPLVLGAVLDVGDGELANTALLVDRGIVVARHDKRSLLPFAETMPFASTLPWLRSISPRTGRFRAGRASPALRLAGHPVATSICFEDTLAGPMRELAGESDGAFVVNLTNDVWFDGTHAPETHLLASRLRAVELGRAVVRATRSGVTAAIDPAGRVIARLEPGRADELLIDLPVMKSTTPWGRHGPAIAWCACLALAIASVRSTRRAARPNSTEPRTDVEEPSG
jgi:apolipoprotein N-acyltransferase